MIKENSVFDYLANVMLIFGISVISLGLFCVLFGEDASELSSIFKLGNAGLAIDTLGQFLAVSFIISGVRWLFFTDRIIKNMAMTNRCIGMLICIIIVIAIFAGVFDWFPVGMVKPWVMFFICFFVCAAVSVGISVLKEKSDNRKMQDALDRLKGDDIS